MEQLSSDMTLIFIFVAVVILSLFFTGLYFILRSYSGESRKKDELESYDERIDRHLKSESENKLDDQKKKIDANKISLKDALSQSRKSFWSHLSFSKDTSVDDVLERFEEALYMGDVGPQTVSRLVDHAQDYFKKEKLNELNLKNFLQLEMKNILGDQKMSEDVYKQLTNLNATEDQELPLVLLIVGVNGAGKTTTIGKLAQNLVRKNKKVLIAAGDTFRAAAEEQLKVWSERAQAEIFSPVGVLDPSAVAFDAIVKAKSGGFDVCIIDTAGRLHTQTNLMDELEKVKRVIKKVIPSAPHHTWIVLDANSGQNALFQAKSFHEKLQLTGVILTKMDGTAKGGMALAVANELKLPIRYIGVGEQAADLRPFNQQEFVDSLV